MRARAVHVRRSSQSVVERLRSLRAVALERGRRVFQVVELGGVPVRSAVVRGEFCDVASALDAARRWGVVSCVVREWACLPGGLRVHVDSVEWLLEWRRIRGIRDLDKQERGAPIRRAGQSPCPSGASGASPFPTSKHQSK